MEQRKTITYAFPGELEFLEKYDDIKVSDQDLGPADRDINTGDLLSLNLNLTNIEEDLMNEDFLKTEFLYVFANTLKPGLYDPELSKYSHLELIYSLLERSLYHAKNTDDIYKQLLPFLKQPKEEISRYKKRMFQKSQEYKQ